MSKIVKHQISSITRSLSILESRRDTLGANLREMYSVISHGNCSSATISAYESFYHQHRKLVSQIEAMKRRRSILHRDHEDHTHRQSQKTTQGLGVALSVLFIIAGLFITSPTITGFATTSTISATSNLTIITNVAIQGNNLSEIQFGELVPNTDDNNATVNYNGTDESSAYITMGPNTSVDVDLCVNATLLTSGANTIARANYTMTNGTTTDINTPPVGAGSTEIPDAFEKYIDSVSRSGRVYHRFWLDIPQQQAAGTYTNAITFKAVATSLACSA